MLQHSHSFLQRNHSFCLIRQQTIRKCKNGAGNANQRPWRCSFHQHSPVMNSYYFDFGNQSPVVRNQINNIQSSKLNDASLRQLNFGKISLNRSNTLRTLLNLLCSVLGTSPLNVKYNKSYKTNTHQTLPEHHSHVVSATLTSSLFRVALELAALC